MRPALFHVFIFSPSSESVEPPQVRSRLSPSGSIPTNSKLPPTEPFTMFSILISFLRSLLTPLYNLQTLLQRIHSLHSPRMPTVKATLKLFKPLDIHKDEKPFICEFNVKGLPGARPTNVELEPHQVPIHDIRGFERQFTLDQNGFEIVQHETSLALEDFTSPSAIESRYLGECQELVRQHCGAKQVVVIGYNLRDNAPGLDTKYKGAMRPFATVHIGELRSRPWFRVYPVERGCTGLIRDWMARTRPVTSCAVCQT